MRYVIFITLLALAAFFANGYASVELPPPAASQTGLVRSAVEIHIQGDAVEGHRLRRLAEADPDASYPHPHEPVIEQGVFELPAPDAMPANPRRLSLRDAIALALRSNPNVKISELQRILDKFGLELSLQPSWVQWSPLTLTSTVQNKAVPVWSAGSGIAVNAPSGTSFSVAHVNNLLGGPGETTIKMTQHLLKGFGLKVNQVPYRNAFDTEKIARLNFKNSVITVVVNVITNYRSLVEAYNSLDTSKQTLKSQEQTVLQSKLQVKMGTMAPSDLLQQQENLESTRLSVVQQEDALRDAYQNFLSSLGLIPSAKILIDRHISVSGVHIPSRNDCVRIALKHNIAYRQALIQLEITKRALITAEDARKWTLDLTSQVELGAQRSAVGQPITDLTESQTNPNMELSLSVPIDNVSAKQAVVSAKIAIEDAKLTLEQQKEDLIRQVWDQWDTIENQYQQIKVSELAIQLQEQTLKNAKLKLKYGKSTVFEVNTLLDQLVSQQIALIGTDISYLNAVTTLRQTLASTLDHWHIKLRY